MIDGSSAPVASIVLCTRNRAESLLETLRSLDHEESRTSAELIVVNNGSEDQTDAVVASWSQDARLPVTLLHEQAIGLANARNAGVRAARGEYILFLDDDVIVHRHWIEELVAGFAPGVAMVAGRILPHYCFDPPGWLRGGGADALPLWDYGDVPFEMDEQRMPLGANMAVRAEHLQALDPPFHPQLGHTGTIRTGHEEFYLASQLSGRIKYVPDAVVDHMVDARRGDLGFARSAYFQLGFGRARYDRLLGAASPRLSYCAARLAWMILKTAALRAGNSRKRALPPAAVRRELIAYYHVGHSVDQLFCERQSIADWCARTLV